SNNSSAIIRSYGNQTVARPVDGAIPSGGSGNRDSGNSGSTFRGWSQGNAPVGDSSNRSTRTFNYNANNSNQTNRFSTTGPQTDGSSTNTSRGGTTFSPTGRDTRVGSNDSNQVTRGF